MTIQEKAERIIKDIKKEKGNNPIQIFKRIAKFMKNVATRSLNLT